MIQAIKDIIWSSLTLLVIWSVAHYASDVLNERYEPPPAPCPFNACED